MCTIPYEENSTAIIDSLQDGNIDAGFVPSGQRYVAASPFTGDKFTVVVL